MDSKEVSGFVLIFLFLLTGLFKAEAFETKAPKKEASEKHLDSSSEVNTLKKKHLSSRDFYNLGIDFYHSGNETKAIASFRKSLYLDSWAWDSWRALNFLGHPASSWWIIPFDVFLLSVALGLIFFIFSIRIWKVIFLIFCLSLSFVFFYHRRTPRVTVIKDVFSRTAPSLSSSEAFSLESGDWVILLKTKKNWVQVEKQKAAAWIPKSEVF